VVDPVEVFDSLEMAIDGLASDVRADDGEWFVERLEEFGLEPGVAQAAPGVPQAAAGVAQAAPDALPPDRELVREACMWLLFDCPLPDGRTPVERLAATTGGRTAQLLLRSELRVWRLDTIVHPDAYGALCPLGSGLARVEARRKPRGVPVAGALLVGRSVPLGPQWWAIPGRARVVEPVAAPAFEALMASLDAPTAEFWRVHGGVLARAACGVAATATAHAPAAAPAKIEAGRHGQRQEERTLERIATALRRPRRHAA